MSRSRKNRVHEAPSNTAFTDDPLWYKDAVIYQLHVKSFCDGNGDGIGDFAGLIDKLDYIAELGVNTVWLLPFYPSPRRDDGYDIAEYRGEIGSASSRERVCKYVSISVVAVTLKKKTKPTTQPH